jgi:hypothetical protein
MSNEEMDRRIWIVLWIVAPLEMLYAKLVMFFILRGRDEHATD